MIGAGQSILACKRNVISKNHWQVLDARLKEALQRKEATRAETTLGLSHVEHEGVIDREVNMRECVTLC